ncbi:MAG: Uncharacterised protein [Formosa sp. Hel1_33_131]|jgi:hypothetical protein|nr:MAG: Uncharacterised protein [Formosa sp. Hel1_33_131]|tara:strand:- start:7125 stop:7808 length:684 start_codon:yes stop_codon:yes gene_type:complete
MKQALLFATAFLLFFSCVETDYKNDRVDPEIFISNPLSTLEEGTDYQLETKYFNYVGKEIENPVVNWSTENPTILTVSETGLVTGISMGVAIITASLITKEENLTITNTNKITVSMSTAVEPVKFEGTITSTSSYLLKGSYTLEPLDAGGVKLSLGEDYEADTSLPGLYIYLGNNPNSTADAFEIGPVTTFDGAHFYDLPTIGIYDYNYVLYWCKPFGVKVGEGQIK